MIHSSMLANLHTFECTAHALSFTIAAEQLCLTPSAVSHRIRKLEEQLGFKLFHRYPRKLQLTDEGQRILTVLSGSFKSIDDEIEQIRNNELSGSLRLFARPTITQCWLVPKLADFHARHPSITLNIRTGNEDIDFRTQQVDLALLYCDGAYAGMHCHWLMGEELIPVCSPSYASEHNLFGKPQNLSSCLLLHDASAWNLCNDAAEWELWINAHQINDLDINTGYCFDRSDLAVIAALNNTGVAMGRRALVQKRLDKGELVEPFAGMRVESPQQYYLIVPPDRLELPKVRAVMSWLDGLANADKP